VRVTQLIPKGCFDPDLLDKYLIIKNYLMAKDMYNIAAPSKYHFLSYVVVRTKSETEGVVLELFHETFKKLILRAVPRSGQIGCKYQIFSGSDKRQVGCVRGNLLDGKFFVFDDGYNPSKKKLPVRKELAYIYTSSS
jgi:hypothetical protein